MTLAIRDKTRFLTYASEFPDHMVRLKRVTRNGLPVWLAQPAQNANAYTLSFTLPVESVAREIALLEWYGAFRRPAGPTG